MFMQRLITSLILIPLVLWVIFYANPWVCSGIVILITILASTECWHLIPVDSVLMKTVFSGLLLLGVFLCFYWFHYWLIAGLVLWIFLCVAVMTYPASQRYWGKPVLVASIFFVILPLFVQSLISIYLFPQGQALIVYLFFLVWAADIGAYLAGKRWGTHKVIPKVSPGKSWEGVTGGFVLALLVAVGGSVWFTPRSFYLWFFWAVLTIIITVFGDLFMSILKRRCCLKDTGFIIPGHGGILDRLDSLIAAAPVFTLGLTLGS